MLGQTGSKSPSELPSAKAIFTGTLADIQSLRIICLFPFLQKFGVGKQSQGSKVPVLRIILYIDNSNVSKALGSK